MTREELVGELIWEGFPLRAAEHEADLILGSRDDDRMPEVVGSTSTSDLVTRLFQPYKES